MTQEQMDSNSLIGAFRDAGLAIKGIACIVILTFGGLVTSPAIAAVKQEVQKIQWSHPDNKAAELSKTLKGVHQLLDNLQLSVPTTTAATKTATTSAAFSNKQADAFKVARKQLIAYRDQLKTLDKDTLDQFASVKAHLLKHHLPQVILDREAKAEATYKSRMTALMTQLNAANAATDNATFQQHVLKMKAQLDQQMKEHPKTHFDPNNLPNRSLKPNLNRKPLTTKKQFAEAGFISNPYIQVASLTNNFDISHMPSAQDPAYLAATTEVTLSPAIKAKAAALNYNPVEIYNWVRNNVVWQPTWGAVQDADLTLSAQRGNAFDISSLLISLLRASGIPARYVQGTINVPEAKFRNWMGGFQNINPAIEYASSGGIPITGLISGGKITTVQMEHIWVEAAVDYFPSRGVKNISANTWVPMDASYKQYTFKKGLDPVAISGIDLQTLTNNYLASGTVDATDGYISGLNPAVLQTAEQNAQTSVESYIAQNLPNATVGDVLGGREIIVPTRKGLSASLSNPVVIVGARYGTLPAALEQSISFALGLDALGEPTNPKSFPWPELNNQQVTLSFQPATDSDRQALESLLPTGVVTDDSQYPSSIPAYLINVIPELKLNGAVIMSGSSMTLGQDLTFVFQPNFVGRQTVQNTYNVSAGSYLDVATIAGNVSPGMLSSLFAKIQQTQAVIASQDSTQLQGLTAEELEGNIFQAGLLSYYAQYTSFADIMGVHTQGYFSLAAGMGTYGFEPHVDYLFGIPTDIRDGGAVMNIPIVNILGSDAENSNNLKSYDTEVGVISSELEASVPEAMFNTSTQSMQAASTVTVMGLASQQGQKIYSFTQTNANLLSQISLSATTRQEISTALSNGMTVVAHQNPVDINGWVGSGYVVTNPATGDGAYKISGGANGGYGKLAPEAAKELFWAGLDKFGGKIGKALGKLNDIYNEVTSFVELIKNCPTETAIAGIISITLITVAFALLVPAFAAIALIVELAYLVFAGIVVSLVSEGWVESCKNK